METDWSRGAMAGVACTGSRVGGRRRAFRAVDRVSLRSAHSTRDGHVMDARETPRERARLAHQRGSSACGGFAYGCFTCWGVAWGVSTSLQARGCAARSSEASREAPPDGVDGLKLGLRATGTSPRTLRNAPHATFGRAHLLPRVLLSGASWRRGAVLRPAFRVAGGAWLRRGIGACTRALLHAAVRSPGCESGGDARAARSTRAAAQRTVRWSGWMGRCQSAHFTVRCLGGR